MSVLIRLITMGYPGTNNWHEVNKQESSFKNDHTGQAFYVNSFLRELRCIISMIRVPFPHERKM